MDKVTRNMIGDFCMIGITALLSIGVASAAYGSDIAVKDQQIADLERAVDVLEEANASIKADAEAKQTVIENLELELERTK